MRLNTLMYNYETEIEGDSEWGYFKDDRGRYLKTEEANNPPDINKIKTELNIKVYKNIVQTADVNQTNNSLVDTPQKTKKET
jgi:hypothetical protein